MYDVIELIGTSNESWEKAAANAVEQASKSLRDLRVAEIVELDMQLDAKGKVEAYRARSSYRSNTRSALALSAGPPEPKSQRCPGARVRDSALLACFTPRISVYGFPTTQANEVVAPIHPEAMSCDPDHR